MVCLMCEEGIKSHVAKKEIKRPTLAAWWGKLLSRKRYEMLNAGLVLLISKPRSSLIGFPQREDQVTRRMQAESPTKRSELNFSSFLLADRFRTWSADMLKTKKWVFLMECRLSRLEGTMHQAQARDQEIMTRVTRAKMARIFSLWDDMSFLNNEIRLRVSLIF